MTLNFKGLMSESHCCIDCGFNTAPGCPNREEAEQEVTNQVAASAKMTPQQKKNIPKEGEFDGHVAWGVSI
jgi:hypothetical protein